MLFGGDDLISLYPRSKAKQSKDTSRHVVNAPKTYNVTLIIRLIKFVAPFLKWDYIVLKKSLKQTDIFVSTGWRGIHTLVD